MFENICTFALWAIVIIAFLAIIALFVWLGCAVGSYILFPDAHNQHWDDKYDERFERMMEYQGVDTDSYPHQTIENSERLDGLY